MSSALKLLGLDFGSTTSSALLATAKLARNYVTGRTELCEVTEIYRSEPVFTPMGADGLDISVIERHVDRWMAESGIRSSDIFGGGAIVTGLAAQQTNAGLLTQLIRARLGNCLVATADDPRLESWLAFMGNCLALSQSHPDSAFLNLDIGGGTTNMAWGSAGEVTCVGCYFIGARHIQFVPGTYRIVRLSKFGRRILQAMDISKSPGDTLLSDELGQMVSFYVRVLEDLVAGNPAVVSPAVNSLEEVAFRPGGTEDPIITLSGGVGELAYQIIQGKPVPSTTAYGDLGIDLARGICESKALARNLREFMPAALGRATVLGLAAHNTEISGSTLFLPHARALPLYDMPILGRATSETEADQMRYLLLLAKSAHRPVCLEVSCSPATSGRVRKLGMQLATMLQEIAYPADWPLVLLAEQNIGKTLGHYASAWGKGCVSLLVIDEVSGRGAKFVTIGPVCDNGATISFYGLGR